jgi:omega-6 fatty acid desaturase (delta-12 desaturase)
MKLEFYSHLNHNEGHVSSVLSMSKTQLWEQLKNTKLSEIRNIIPTSCYQKSFQIAIFWLIFDVIAFTGGLILVFSTHLISLKLLGSSISGIATAMLFVWGHDAAHGTLFSSNRLAEVLGTIAMLPSLNMYRHWSYGHNKVHHGFTSLTPIDWIWRPLSPKAYLALNQFQKLFYRIERSLAGSALHYLKKVWWDGMIKFNPGTDKATQKQYYRNGKMISLIYAVMMSLLGYFFSGGILGIVFVVILPFIIFNYFIAIIVYLHHTHPDLPFFDIKRKWSHSVGFVYCSTIIHCSKIWKMLLHNIMVHIPHHLDIRIPFYHLPEAYAEIKKNYGKYIKEYDFSWREVRQIFSECKLYDFEKNCWLTFKELKNLNLTPEKST